MAYTITKDQTDWTNECSTRTAPRGHNSYPPYLQNRGMSILDQPPEP